MRDFPSKTGEDRHDYGIEIFNDNPLATGTLSFHRSFYLPLF
jgi:hypothetical protein